MDEYKICLSLPVHENPECVVDLLYNIKKCIPEAAVVVHVARQFSF